MPTITDITARISDIQERMEEAHAERREMALNAAIQLGIDTSHGINLDQLSAWARNAIALNAELKALADERRSLRATRKEQAPCVCNCH
jgi:hypothetical protein